VVSGLASREAFWWRAVAAALGLILLSAWPLQFALDFLRSFNLLRLTMAAVFLVVAFAALLWLRRREAGWREWGTALGIAAVYAAIALRLRIVQERLHLVEYGLVALLFAAALSARLGAAGLPAQAVARRAMPLAFAATALAGLLDEVVQGVLPNRRFDLRDLALDALAGALALAAAGALAAARRADRRGSGAGTDAEPAR